MIDKELFDDYERALSANASLVRAAVALLIAGCEGMPGAELRRALARDYPDTVAAYGAFAAAAAVEFYALQRACADAKGRFEPRQYEPDDRALCQYDVAAALEASRDLEALARSLGATSVQRVMERADETLVRNAQADPAHPKWALVPHVGACDWCKMLGSRGFVYRSQATAAASRHSSCRCTPVVDFDKANPSLEGYDPEALFEHYIEHSKGKFSARRSSGRGPSEAARPIGGLGSVGSVQQHMKEAESMEDMLRRSNEAASALRALLPKGGSTYEKAFSAVKAAARERYAELRRMES